MENRASRSCKVPSLDHYADINGVERICDPVLNAVILGGTASPTENSAQCRFICPSGYAKNTEDLSCCPPGYMKAEGRCIPKRTVVDLAVGNAHNCIVLDDGSVKCWGSNGGGTGTSGATRDMVTVNLDQRALDVEAGQRHTCALLEDRSVKCWGRNNEGQTTNAVPNGVGIVKVDLGNDSQGNPLKALEIGLGLRHTCAIVDDGYGDELGLVKCWGWNSEGQKDGTNATSNTSMVTVNLGQGVKAKALALGNKHTCVIFK